MHLGYYELMHFFMSKLFPDTQCSVCLMYLFKKFFVCMDFSGGFFGTSHSMFQLLRPLIRHLNFE